MLTLQTLLSQYAHNGRLEWIGTRPARKRPMVAHTFMAIIEKGLQEDRSVRPSKRSVTLIQYEHLPAIEALCAIKSVKPELLRRNLVVSGINLLALKDIQFKIGNVILEGTGICAPCSYMETVLGKGGYNAVRGHGGITAKVIQSGSVKIGDSICRIGDYQ